VNNLRSTLAIVWRIAIPYFRSEDKWAGRGLLATVIIIQLLQVAIDVLVNAWRNRFYNALQQYDWDSFVRELGRCLGRAGRIRTLSQPVAADPLATLVDQ
jgi:putative ATP-binding cassette transporter